MLVVHIFVHVKPDCIEALLAEIKQPGRARSEKLHAIGHQRLHVHLFVAGSDDLDGEAILAEHALFCAKINRQSAGERAGSCDPQKRLRGTQAWAQKG